MGGHQSVRLQFLISIQHGSPVYAKGVRQLAFRRKLKTVGDFAGCDLGLYLLHDLFVQRYFFRLVNLNFHSSSDLCTLFRNENKKIKSDLLFLNWFEPISVCM